MSAGWQMNKQCEECPWRKDVPTGKFPVKRFEELRPCVEQGFGVMFACHKSPEENKRACVGYVVNQVWGPGRGPENFHLRHALAMGRIDPERMTLTGPQYLTYDEMVEANRDNEVNNGENQDGDGSALGQPRAQDRCGLHR